MNNLFLRILLNLYFYFQCFATIINFILFVLLSFFFVYLYGSVAESQILLNIVTYLFLAIIILLIFQLYVIITPISAIATMKILLNKTLTKLQKFSLVSFPIITILLYLSLILYLVKPN